MPAATTNNFSPATPRKLFLGPFQPGLETALAETIRAAQADRPLTPVTVVVPTRLLGVHLRRVLARHANVRFTTLDELVPARPPKLALELQCRQLAQHCTGYFAPVAASAGFSAALLNTFTDLAEAGLDSLPGTTPKLRELAAAYGKFHVLRPPFAVCRPPAPVFLYGFYDLNAEQQSVVAQIDPAAVFFPSARDAAYAQPLRDWFESRGYQIVPTPPAVPATQSIVSAAGETAEVRQAIALVLDYLRQHPGKTLADCALLCRARDQYDAILRDTLRQLEIPAFFRGGRPLSEHPDAHRLLLLLETVRTDYSRAAVMELACHIGPHAHWDALTVQLGIVGGQAQWQARLKEGTPVARFVTELLAATKPLTRSSAWKELASAALAAWHGLGGRHAPVRAAIEALAELDAVQTPVDFATFAEFCQKALDGEREQTARYQDGSLFVGDVMGARGLSFDCVVVLGMVEKGFPRPVREDPLLPDHERRAISPALPIKARGFEEERLLFGLTAGMARNRLVWSYPRLDPVSAQPRLPSHFLLEMTGTHNLKEFEKCLASTAGLPAVDERDFDWVALRQLAEPDRYLAEVAPVVATGVAAERTRWRETVLSRYDGAVTDASALAVLQDRFGLDKLVISATALEDFFSCPFYYFQKHVLRIEEWQEPEAELVINALDLGTLYHQILEDVFREGSLAAIEKRCTEFERTGVTGFPALWAVRKEIIREEIAGFYARERRRLGTEWRPFKYELEFKDLTVAPPVRLRGKIDRIDLSADGRHARVLDYKTGRVPRGVKNNSLAGGTALQLPLYLQAAEQLLAGVTVDEASYLHFTLRGGYKDVGFARETLEAQRGTLTALLQCAADMIRDGVFAQHATEENCRRCEFRPICGNGVVPLAERKRGDARLAAFWAAQEAAS